MCLSLCKYIVLGNTTILYIREVKSNWFKTAVELAKNVKTTGAIYQTSKKVEKEIGSKLSTEPNKVFIELGLGHGNITKRTLDRIHPTSKLYSFDINKSFCTHVSSTLNDERLTIINDSAQHITEHVNQPIDGIVSSLPLTLFSDELRSEILEVAKRALGPNAYFSQILYTRKGHLFEEYFDSVEIKKLINIPLEYIYHCS